MIGFVCVRACVRVCGHYSSKTTGRIGMKLSGKFRTNPNSILLVVGSHRTKNVSIAPPCLGHLKWIIAGKLLHRKLLHGFGSNVQERSY